MRVTWDKFEAALIIDMFYKIKAGEISKQEGATIVSNRLRQYGVKRGIEIDEKYRNINGIMMQLNAVEYAVTDGKYGLSSCSQIFKEIVELYKSNYKVFSFVLVEANKIIPGFYSQEEYKKSSGVRNGIDAMRSREQIIEVIDHHFAYGLKAESPIALMRFRRFYSEEFGESIELDDDNLYQEIKRICFEVDGKLYHISATDKKYVDRLLGHIAEEFNLVYYEKLFDLYNEEFVEHSILSKEILKTVIESLLPQENTRKSYLVFDIDVGRITEKNYLITEICKVWGEDKVRNYEYLIDKLPYIPEEKIKYVLSQSDFFIWNATEEYTRTDLFYISEEQEERIVSSAKEICNMNGAVSLEELPLKDVFDENFELSETAIFNYIYEKVLAEEFSRNGRVLRDSSATDNAIELFQKYCKEKKHYTTEELYLKWEEITGDNRRAHPIEYGNEILIRIDENDFVSDDAVTFDVDKVDAVLEEIITNGFIGIKEITSFVVFPDCGFTWNLYLIESFCRRFSKKYKFLTKIANSKNAGIIAEKSETDDYDELLVEAVARSRIDIEREKIFEYLITNGYLYRHAYKSMDSLIYRANEVRERSK